MKNLQTKAVLDVFFDINKTCNTQQNYASGHNPHRKHIDLCQTTVKGFRNMVHSYYLNKELIFTEYIFLIAYIEQYEKHHQFKENDVHNWLIHLKQVSNLYTRLNKKTDAMMYLHIYKRLSLLNLIKQ